MHLLVLAHVNHNLKLQKHSQNLVKLIDKLIDMLLHYFELLNRYILKYIFIYLSFIQFQMIADLNTYLTKAIPDTKLTIEKYADAKFEYLVRFYFD